jgi:hypothetical protein
MEIALIIVGGLVLMTAVASAFSYLTEKKKRESPELEKRIAQIEQRLTALEDNAGIKDARMEQIAQDMSFVNKLVENMLADGRTGSGDEARER